MNLLLKTNVVRDKRPNLLFWIVLIVSGRVVRWKGGKDGRVVRWQGGKGRRVVRWGGGGGGRFLVLFKDVGRRMSPRIHLLFLIVIKRKKGRDGFKVFSRGI